LQSCLDVREVHRQPFLSFQAVCNCRASSERPMSFTPSLSVLSVSEVVL
jgi:hypothetical protein